MIYDKIYQNCIIYHTKNLLKKHIIFLVLFADYDFIYFSKFHEKISIIIMISCFMKLF